MTCIMYCTATTPHHHLLAEPKWLKYEKPKYRSIRGCSYQAAGVNSFKLGRHRCEDRGKKLFYIHFAACAAANEENNSESLVFAAPQRHEFTSICCVAFWHHRFTDDAFPISYISARAKISHIFHINPYFVADW